MRERQREWRRSWLGAGLYGLAGGLALVVVNASLVLMAVIPFIFIVPNLLQESP